MSYDIDLCDPVSGETLHLDRVHGGTTKLSLNVTYNYAKHFYRVLGQEGIRTIYGKTGAESIPALKDAISSLADDVDDNYWEPTEGNAKASLLELLVMAQLRPDGVWKGD